MSGQVKPIDIVCTMCQAQPYERCRNMLALRSGLAYNKTFHHERKRDAARLNARTREAARLSAPH